MRALLIDDDPAILMVLSYALEAGGEFEVVQTTSWEEGLDAARMHLPDILILDFRLGKMDAVSFLERLRQRPELRGISVVLCTGMKNLEVTPAYRDLGIKGVIGKPFDPLSVAAQIKGFLRA
jgi:two-component system, OmpR family, response regulator